MRLKNLSDRIYFLESDDEKGLPALGYIKGEVFSMMVDAGATPAHAALFIAHLGENGLQEPVFTVVTHHHWDHAYGLSALETISISCRKCAEKLQMLSDGEWDEAFLEKQVKNEAVSVLTLDNFRKCYPDLSEIEVFSTDIAFDGEMNMDLGGCHAVVKQIPSSHSRDCVAVYVPEEKVLFIGDGAESAHVGRNIADDRDELIALQKLLRNLDFTKCIRSHKGVMSKDEILRDLADRLSEVI